MRRRLEPAEIGTELSVTIFVRLKNQELFTVSGDDIYT
jgi:hypothetical protein